VSVESLVIEGRLEAEALMLDRVEIRRSTGAVAQNEATGRTTAASTLVYVGPCKVQSQDALPQAGEVAGREAVTQRYRLDLPVAVTVVRVGDVATITEAALDAELLGRRFRVAGQHHKSQATARRLPVEEVTS
jgi:hypothetical protein